MHGLFRVMIAGWLGTTHNQKQTGNKKRKEVVLHTWLAVACHYLQLLKVHCKPCKKRPQMVHAAYLAGATLTELHIPNSTACPPALNAAHSACLIEITYICTDYRWNVNESLPGPAALARPSVDLQHTGSLKSSAPDGRTFLVGSSAQARARQNLEGQSQSAKCIMGCKLLTPAQAFGRVLGQPVRHVRSSTVLPLTELDCCFMHVQHYYTPLPRH